MHTYDIPPLRPGTLWIGAAVSLTIHALLLILLPGFHVHEVEAPKPLTVEIIPPQPLPLQPAPPTPPQRKPPPKPQVRPVQEPRPVEIPQPRPPLLTAAPQAPAVPEAPVVPAQPETKPAPPAPPAPTPAPPEPPRPQAAPITPPRSDANYLSNQITYPSTARRRGEQGTVLIRVLVTVDGRAGNVALDKSSGFPALDDAALSAVKSWRFQPARQGSQPIEMAYTVPVAFKLN